MTGNGTLDLGLVHVVGDLLVGGGLDPTEIFERDIAFVNIVLADVDGNSRRLVHHHEHVLAGL